MNNVSMWHFDTLLNKINIDNKKGPGIDPCGTPQMICKHYECTPL